jgi:hypothetical protein
VTAHDPIELAREALDLNCDGTPYTLLAHAQTNYGVICRVLLIDGKRPR